MAGVGRGVCGGGTLVSIDQETSRLGRSAPLLEGRSTSCEGQHPSQARACRPPHQHPPPSLSGHFQGKMKITAAFPGLVKDSSALHYSCCLQVSRADTPLRKWVVNVVICAGTYGRRGSGRGWLAGGRPGLHAEASWLFSQVWEPRASPGESLCLGAVVGSGLRGPPQGCIRDGVHREPRCPALGAWAELGVMCREKARGHAPRLAGNADPQS